MIEVGLTGGIGSGKSLCSKVFEMLGAPVFNSDLEARVLMTQNMEVRAGLAELFGADVLLVGGVDRKKIAEEVFSVPSKLLELNAVIHPQVRRRYQKWLATFSLNTCYVIKESAILFETGTFHTLHKIVLVEASRELCIERTMRRDGLSKKQVEQRMANQLPQEEKEKLAHFVIDNNEKQSLLEQLYAVHKALISES